MKWNSIWIMMILVLISSCGQNSSEIFGAPKTTDRTGLIASCTTRDMAQTLATKLEVNFRVINEKKRLVEFLNIDQATLQKELPKSKIKPNKIYNQLIESSLEQQSIAISGEIFNRTTNSLEYFSHLNQISGVNFVNNNQGKGATIAIVDTGVFYNHPHLLPNLKVNNNDSVQGISSNYDDDDNGLVDDHIGWDFYNHDADPMDDNGHGTHVAGLAAGTLGGVAPQASILPIKVLGASGSGDLGTISAGILYAIESGADVVNLSLGGPDSGQLTSDLQELFNVVAYAREKNVMIVAAAGNGGDDAIGDCNDEYNIYPANIDSSNLLAIAAVDSYNMLASYSNYGTNSVHIAAPGGDSYYGGLVSTGVSFCGSFCTSEDAVYYRSTGTSMATPLVSGLVALIKSANPNLKHQSIRDLILKNGTHISALDGLIESANVINVNASLQALEAY